MPIYDQTAAGVNTEIGIIYDQTAAGTNSIIGIVYDQTAAGVNSIVYAAEQYIYNAGMVSGYTWAGKTSNSGAAPYTNNGTSLFCKSDMSTGSAEFVATASMWYVAVDVTNFSTLEFTVDWWTKWDTYNAARFGISSDTNLLGGYYAYVDKCAYNGSGTNAVITVDVSSRTGTVYVKCETFQTYSQGRGAGMTLKKCRLY